MEATNFRMPEPRIRVDYFSNHKLVRSATIFYDVGKVTYGIVEDISAEDAKESNNVAPL